MQRDFPPGKQRFPHRFSPAFRRVFWLGLAVSLLTGMSGRPAKSTSAVSQLLKPVQTLVEKVTAIFTPPAPAPSTEIDPERELTIRALAVTNDARATEMGAWSFGYLMKNLAPPDADPAVFAEAWMRRWIEVSGQNLNDFWVEPSDPEEYPDSEAVGVRAASLEQFLSNWPRTGDGKLDLAKAPFRLLSIVNRLDIGEGRLSFGGIVLDQNAFPDHEVGDALDLLVIFEYSLPSLGADGTVQDAAWWANQWHDLSRYNIQSPAYLQALETLTNRFAARGMSPENVNGSALGHLRIVEQVSDLGPGVDITPVWQMMGFHLAGTGELDVEKLTDTPDYAYDIFNCEENDLCQQQLIDYLLANRSAILDGTWRLNEAEIDAATFAPIFPTTYSWLEEAATPAGLSDDDWSQLRLTFSNRTCNGCHGLGRGYADDLLIQPIEFMQMGTRSIDAPSRRSKFVRQQIRDVRIPNMLSYIAPQDPRARRADPARMAVH